VPFVRDLASWARDLDTEGNQRMKVNFEEPDADAPV
jgi:hypothetical protein